MQDNLLKLRIINDTEPTSMQARNNGGEGFGVMSGLEPGCFPKHNAYNLQEVSAKYSRVSVQKFLKKKREKQPFPCLFSS